MLYKFSLDCNIDWRILEVLEIEQFDKIRNFKTDIVIQTELLKQNEAFFEKSYSQILRNRKYLLRGYILGVLTHTTALDQFWGDDETLTMWF